MGVKRNLLSAQLRPANLHPKKPQDFWKNVLWTDKSQEEMFGHNGDQHVWSILNSISAQTPHTNSQAWWWACFAAMGPCSHEVNHELLFIQNVRASQQQDNDPEHSSKSVTEWLKK